MDGASWHRLQRGIVHDAVGFVVVCNEDVVSWNQGQIDQSAFSRDVGLRRRAQ